jgi:hypothetical protein
MASKAEPIDIGCVCTFGGGSPGARYLRKYSSGEAFHKLKAEGER